MKKVFYPEDSRGKFDFGWLKTNHSFSFGNYYNPERINFGMLRVLNDDFVQGGQGFDTHPHKDMEIITIPLSGALEHKDSTGGRGVLYPNEVQVMSAGTGIEHSEFNHLKDETSNFLQIWILPNKKGHQPRYDQKYFNKEERKNKLQLIVSPEKENGSLWINQNAFIYLTELDQNIEMIYDLHSSKNGVYLFLISGEISAADQILHKRDAIGIWETNSFKINAIKDSFILLIEVPMEQ